MPDFFPRKSDRKKLNYWGCISLFKQVDFAEVPMADRVASPEEYLAQSKTNPGKICMVSWDKGKPIKGSVFFDTRSEITTLKGPVKSSLFAIVMPKNADESDALIPLVSIKSPEEHIKKEAEKGKTFRRLQVKMRTSECGAYGEATTHYSNEFTAMVTKYVDSLTEQTDKHELKRKKVKGAAQTHVSKTAKENAGAVIDDPYITHNVDFDARWPDRHPRKSLQGKPKTILLDYDKKSIDPVTGAITFEPAMVEDDDGNLVPVTNDNVHKFINNGAMLFRGRAYFDGVCASASVISQVKHCVYLVVKRGGDGVGTDDIEYASPEEIAAARAAAAAAAAVTTPPPPSEQPPTDDVNDLLENM